LRLSLEKSIAPAACPVDRRHLDCAGWLPTFFDFMLCTPFLSAEFLSVAFDNRNPTIVVNRLICLLHFPNALNAKGRAKRRPKKGGMQQRKCAARLQAQPFGLPGLFS
jgi:hypothetical protein